MYSRNDALDILHTPVSKFGLEDKIIWNGSTSGQYTAKQGYNCRLNHERINGSVPSTAKWSLIWKLHLPPKIKSFCWKLLHQSLPTGDLLKQRKLDIQGNCFFGCPHS